MYDIIGDIHGHASELEALLDMMGYRKSRGVYRHQGRSAVFVGDYIDRGNEISKTLKIVMSMVRGGSAFTVLGNHEYNAIAYHTERPNGGYYREHSEKNWRQHEQTLLQLNREELSASIAWFKTLPFYLELKGIRVVHACWHLPSLGIIDKALNGSSITIDFLDKSTGKSHELYKSVEYVLKGPEMKVPESEPPFKDKDGHARRDVRFKWFLSPVSKSFASHAFDYEKPTSKMGIPDLVYTEFPGYPVSDVPVFFGHYWREGAPCRQSENTCCVDYSVAKKGKLVAYRWDGEGHVSDDKFVCIGAFS